MCLKSYLNLGTILVNNMVIKMKRRTVLSMVLAPLAIVFGVKPKVKVMNTPYGPIALYGKMWIPSPNLFNNDAFDMTPLNRQVRRITITDVKVKVY